MAPYEKKNRPDNFQRDTIPASDRIPPQAIEVERTVLGSMLIDLNAASTALELLDESCFYTGANRSIFLCMKEMFEKSIPIDIVTLADTLRKKSLMETIGDESYLAELAESIATASNIEYYAGILLEKATLRQLISIAGEITTDCFNLEVEPQMILDQAEAKIFSISESRVKTSSSRSGSCSRHSSKVSKGMQRVPTRGSLPGLPNLTK